LRLCSHTLDSFRSFYQVPHENRKDLAIDENFNQTGALNASGYFDYSPGIHIDNAQTGLGVYRNERGLEAEAFHKR
jgi:hypothetical protein